MNMPSWMRTCWLIAGVVPLGAGCNYAGVGPLSRWSPEVKRYEASAPSNAPRTFAAARSESPEWFRLAAGDEGSGETRGSHQPDTTPITEEAVEEQAAPARRFEKPLPSLWDTIRRDVRAMPEDLWADTKAVYTSAPNLVILGLTYGGSLAIQETGPDGTVERHFTGDSHHSFDASWRDAFGAAGNPGTHFAVAGLWYLAGQQSQDEKTYNVGKTLFSALIINGASTMAGKAASWDDSPNGEWGAFPSGHTSSTFTFASVMHRAYGPWVGAPLYALGGLVAYERLEDGEHYLSDVVMGGVMGLVIGHAVAGERELELFGGRIMPYADPESGASGLAWVKQFK